MHFIWNIWYSIVKSKSHRQASDKRPIDTLTPYCNESSSKMVPDLFYFLIDLGLFTSFRWRALLPIFARARVIAKGLRKMQLLQRLVNMSVWKFWFWFCWHGDLVCLISTGSWILLVAVKGRKWRRRGRRRTGRLRLLFPHLFKILMGVDYIPKRRNLELST